MLMIIIEFLTQTHFECFEPCKRVKKAKKKLNCPHYIQKVGLQDLYKNLVKTKKKKKSRIDTHTHTNTL